MIYSLFVMFSLDDKHLFFLFSLFLKSFDRPSMLNSVFFSRCDVFIMILFLRRFRLALTRI